MGQGQSGEAQHQSLEQLSSKLAHRFAEKCYTPLELYCYKDVFKSLADTQSGVRYWSESTLCRFLELPDALAVGSVVFQMACYLGAFPFPSQAPAILTNEALLKVVTILTERYGAVLKRRNKDVWRAEIYRGLAVHDRGMQNVLAAQEEGAKSAEKSLEDQTRDSLDGLDHAVQAHNVSKSGQTMGFAIDKAEDGDDGEVEDDDDLILAAFESMDVNDAFKHGEHSDVQHSIIPSDNFLKLLELLLLIAPLEPQDNLATYSLQLTEDRVEQYRTTARDVLSAFNIETNPGVTYRTFDRVVPSSLPYLFDGLRPLFEHFLFAKDFDLSKKKHDTMEQSKPPTTPKVPSTIQHSVKPPGEPILAKEGEILNLPRLSQLSFFIKGNNLFRRLRLLYSGNEHGFSMGSFQKQVFNWRAPSILLVSGTLLPFEPSNIRERTLQESLPHSRLPSSTKPSNTVTYGAYIPTPWQQTHKQSFGNNETILFQLSPTHDVFHASSISTDYIYFNRSPTFPSGLGLGTTIPSQTKASTRSNTTVPLGPVSLHLDDGLEFAIFTHLSEGGGSFQPSQYPSRKKSDWQDRFEIESLEIWGCGGDEEADAQRRQWAWEEREAEARRRINLGTGDVETDKELLRMAGIIGAGQSGGSMG